MKITNSILIISMLFTGCASLDSIDTKRQTRSPNHFGWDSTNCAHIMADGHCAHPIGANSVDTENILKPVTIPSANQFKATNCVHVLADGTCAHPL